MHLDNDLVKPVTERFKMVVYNLARDLPLPVESLQTWGPFYDVSHFSPEYQNKSSIFPADKIIRTHDPHTDASRTPCSTRRSPISLPRGPPPIMTISASCINFKLYGDLDHSCMPQKDQREGREEARGICTVIVKGGSQRKLTPVTTEAFKTLSDVIRGTGSFPKTG